MTMVDFEGRRFEVMRVLDPDVAMVSLDGSVQGCAQILRGALVANLSADGSSRVSARTIAEVALRSGYGLGFPIA